MVFKNKNQRALQSINAYYNDVKTMGIQNLIVTAFPDASNVSDIIYSKHVQNLKTNPRALFEDIHSTSYQNSSVLKNFKNFEITNHSQKKFHKVYQGKYH